jgi:hypothetical protein
MRTLPALLRTMGTMAMLSIPALAGGTDLTPARVTNLVGTLEIEQDAPCNNHIQLATPVTAGGLQLTPAEGRDVTAGKAFMLTRVNVTFAGFSVTRSCAGFTETRTYGDIVIQLGRATSFTAVSAGNDIYSVTIPQAGFQMYQAATLNGKPETRYVYPTEDVTGTIDLGHGTVSMRVAISESVRFQAGCVGSVCIINEVHDGTRIANVSGTIAFPDADGDGVPDRADNCRFTANADQSAVSTPTIAAPTDVTFASCADRAIGIASAKDVCDGGPVTVTSDAPATFAAGANTVTWTATDASGRRATATQTITVVDTTTPTFTSAPLDVTAGNCGPVSLGTVTATDDCAGTPSIANDALPTFGIGETIVTWTATDASGNTSTATQKVTVTDTVAPAASCVASAPVGHEFLVSSGDACGAATIRLGSFVLANGERIKINETGQPGVTFAGLVGPDAIRHFLVGPGQAVITVTDPSGNTATAACR